MTDGSDVIEAKAAQRAHSKRATMQALRGKKPARQEFETEINGEMVSMLFVSIGSTEWDKLISKHEPTNEQIARGQVYNPDTFAPALLARVCKEPDLSTEEWAEIWTSPEWSQGEVSEIFMRAYNLCNKGLEMAPIAAG